MKAHPAADLFPMMSSLALAELAKSIKESGQEDPIVLIGDLILDGRNRWKACKIAGVEPKVEQWDGNGSPVEYVLKKNLHRRDLTPTDRALIAVEAEKLFQEEARVRQRAGVAPKKEQGDASGRSLEKAAAMTGASKTNAYAAKKVLVDGTPELVAALREKKVAAQTAAAIASMPPDRQREIVSSGPDEMKKHAPKSTVSAQSASHQSLTGEIRRLKSRQKKALEFLEAFMKETKDKNEMQVSILVIRGLVRKAIEVLEEE